MSEAIVSDDLIAELERLEKAATPGPWRLGADHEGICPGWRDERGNMLPENLSRNGYAKTIAKVLDQSWCPGEQRLANGQLIPALRNALPSIVHRLRTSEANRAYLMDLAAQHRAELEARAEKAEAEVARLRSDAATLDWIDKHNIAVSPQCNGGWVIEDAEPESQSGDADIIELCRTRDGLREALRVAMAERASTHPASRADPAPPIQSSAQPAAERVENWPPINLHTGRPCDHSYVRFPLMDNPVCDLCGNSHAEIARRTMEDIAAPPAAGSAAGKRGGS